MPGNPAPTTGDGSAGTRRCPGAGGAGAARAAYAVPQLAAGDTARALELNLGWPDRSRAFDGGGLVDLRALDANALEQHARVTAAEAASIVSTRDKLGRLSSVDGLVVHGDLTLPTAERLRDYAVFIG